MPNEVAQGYNYDEANQLLSITYTKADGTVIDVVSYTYDETATGLPAIVRRQAVKETPFTATYDNNNRMLTYNGYPLTYDDNGNLISRQTEMVLLHTTMMRKTGLFRSWAQMTTASLNSDAQAGAQRKQLMARQHHFLYDGPQAIAELQG